MKAKSIRVTTIKDISFRFEECEFKLNPTKLLVCDEKTSHSFSLKGLKAFDIVGGYYD